MRDSAAKILSLLIALVVVATLATLNAIASGWTR